MLAKVLANIIRSGQYENEDMQNKLDVFLSFSRITLAQYNELMALMAEYPPIAAE